MWKIVGKVFLFVPDYRISARPCGSLLENSPYLNLLDHLELVRCCHILDLTFCQDAGEVFNGILL
jgi:hypothetical protein